MNKHKQKTIKIIIVEKLRSYCKNSTLHGVFYFYRSNHWWVHVTWALVITSTIGLCCFLSHMIWDKFAVDPTLTVVESTHYSVSYIPFPAVTLCDTEIVYGPRTENITELLVLRGFNLSQIDEFYKSFSNVRRRDYSPEPYVRKMHSLLEDLGYPLHLLLNILKKPCDSLIVECKWRSQSHNCTSMFRSVYTIAGFCCQFDISYFSKHIAKSANFLSGVDVTEALDIVVDGQKVFGDGHQTNEFALLYVFDHHDQVTLMDSAITVAPGAFFDINVFVWAIDSSDNVIYLPLKSRKCILETVKLFLKDQGHHTNIIKCDSVIVGLSFFLAAMEQRIAIMFCTKDTGVGAGFYQGCMSRLIMRRVVNHCRCLPFQFTASQLGVEDYVICNWDRLMCIYQTIAKVQIDIRAIISENECYQRCNYVQYESEVEFVKNHRLLNETRSRVAVHFGDTTCIKYRREVLYTWDQMLANLGGIFGLCLGGSIISVIEILWFVLDLIFAVVATTHRKRVAPKDKEANKIFTLTNEDWMYRKNTGKNSRFKFIN